MLFHLFDYLQREYNMAGAGLFQYISFRAGLAVLISLIITLVLGGRIIAMIQRMQIIEKQRVLGLPGEEMKAKTPTMGGLMIHMAILIPCLLLADLTNIYIQMLIITTLLMGSIGFLDDYLKLTRGKDGLAGRYKIIGQVTLGIIIGLMMMMSDEVVVRVDQQAMDLHQYEVIDTVEVERTLATIGGGTQVVKETMYNVKTTVTNVPFFKGNEFDYIYLVKFLGKNAHSWVWFIFIPFIIFIVTAVSNAANLTDGIDGLAAGTSAIIGAVLCVLAYVSGNTILADYLGVLYVPNVGELVIFSACFSRRLYWFFMVQCFSRTSFYGRYWKFSPRRNNCRFSNCHS